MFLQNSSAKRTTARSRLKLNKGKFINAAAPNISNLPLSLLHLSQTEINVSTKKRLLRETF